MRRLASIEGRPVLLEGDVDLHAAIVRKALGGTSQADLARQHGVSRQRIHQIVSGGIRAGTRIVYGVDGT